MSVSTGNILISTASMDDPRFRESIVFITEYNESGAVGFVINKVFERPLSALAEFSSSPAFPLYEGGPVDKEHLFFIHQRNDLIPGGAWIIGNVYFGGDFKQAISCVNNKTLDENEIKIFIGYCGWDTGELEEEIAAGSWTVKGCEPGIVFTNSSQLYGKLS
ncbi:YqgE/AlgH family protein [Chitinophagaceae bacterium MMS25-I14]